MMQGRSRIVKSSFSLLLGIALAIVCYNAENHKDVKSAPMEHPTNVGGEDQTIHRITMSDDSNPSLFSTGIEADDMNEGPPSRVLKAKTDSSPKGNKKGGTEQEESPDTEKAAKKSNKKSDERTSSPVSNIIPNETSPPTKVPVSTPSPTVAPETSPTDSPVGGPAESPVAGPTESPVAGSPESSPSTGSPESSPSTGSPESSPSTGSPESSTSPNASPISASLPSASQYPSTTPSESPSASRVPSIAPSASPSSSPSASPSTSPSASPSTSPSASPSTSPSTGSPESSAIASSVAASTESSVADGPTEPGETCDNNANEDCLSGACGRESFPDGEFICCPSASFIASGNIWCDDQPVGAECFVNSLCSSGVCIGGICQDGPKDPGETCDNNDNDDCLNGACGRESYPAGEMICCPSGSFVITGDNWCDDQPVGAECFIDSLCSSGVCNTETSTCQ